MVSSAVAAEIKIGFVTTLTTPAAVIGEDMKNAVNLALEHLNGKAGSHKIEVVFGDDGFAPDTGKQVTDRLLKQDKVDIIAGIFGAMFTSIAQVCIGCRENIDFLKCRTFTNGEQIVPRKFLLCLMAK